MFASTNLVIELGVLIFIFLGWQYLAAELIGGVVLIAISSILIRLSYPRKWASEARDKVSEESDEEEDFDWRKRIKSREGWFMVGQKFVSDWAMVWEEILIGFTVAGFVAVLVPASFWSKIFLSDLANTLPAWLDHNGKIGIKRFIAYLAAGLVAVGLIVFWLTKVGS